MSEFETGTVIDGRYRVISRIGAGGMADVYLAEDMQLSREVALKLLHRRFSADPGFVERFRREAQSAANLQHPNVVSVFDRGAFEDTYYIAMEYLPGRTLKQLIREEAPLDPVRTIDFTIQILKAAGFGHRRGVIHRDLKPHNVIVDSTDHAKVTDFGIARAGASDMTETGSIMGTAQYLSPEQAQGYPVSEPSDLYSIGIVLYEMLTGRVPFEGESAVTIALKQVAEAPIPPTQINPAVPKPLEQVVLWALNKDAKDRPADAGEFIAALEQAKELIDAPVGEATAAMRAIGPVAAGTSLMPIPATAVLPAPTGAYGSSDNLLQATNGNGNGGRKDDEDRPLWPWLVGLLVLVLIAGGVLAYLLTRPSKVTVPDVVGVQLSVAENKLDADGLNPTAFYQTSSKPVNQVIDQSIDGGAMVDQGATVTLTVSNGPGTVNVPTVAGSSQRQALLALKQAGLHVSRIVMQSSRNTPRGQAISTSPQAGASLARGTAVVLYVSSGPRVPSVVGDTVPQAQSALSNFKVTIVRSVIPGCQINTVCSQSPTGGTSASSGSQVTIYVAKRAASTTRNVPNVVGYTQAGAANTLQGDGFVVRYRNQTVTAQNQVGNVVRQTPVGGSTVKKGSTVTLYIGKLKPVTTTTTTTTTTTPTTT